MLSIIIYFITFGLSIFISYIYDKLKEQNHPLTRNVVGKIICFFFIFSPTLFLAATRKGIGTDYDAYVRFFELSKNVEIGELLATSRLEPGFVILTKFASTISANVEILWFLSALITFLFLFLALDSTSDIISMPIALVAYYALLYAPSFNIIRQILAGSIICLSYRFIIKKQPMLFVLLVILATSFHKTAIIFIICYAYVFLDKQTSAVKKIVLYFFLIAFIFMVPYIPAIGSRVWVIGHYFRYYNQESGFLHILYLIFRAPMYLFIIVYFSKEMYIRCKLDIYYYITLYEIPLLLLTSQYQWAFRMAYYTQYAQIIIIAIMLKNINRLNDRLLLKFLFALYYIMYFILFYYILQHDDIFPYSNIYNNIF